jgi:hypothetical protein
MSIPVQQLLITNRDTGEYSIILNTVKCYAFSMKTANFKVVVSTGRRSYGAASPR